MSSLKKYYRKPSLFIELPSGLNFYSKEFFGDQDLSSLREVGVMPMTTMNELMLKNPESLINGVAIEELIKDSTTLSQVNPKHLFKCDVDALLTGIKIASQGSIQEIELTCPNPKCKHESTFSRDLKQVLASIKKHEPEYPVTLKNVPDITIYLKPSTFEDNLILEANAFEEQKKITQIKKNINEMTRTQEIEEEDEIKFLTMIHEIFRDITMSTIHIYANAVLKIVDVEGEEFTDREEIIEFLNQLDTDSFSTIRENLEEINSLGLDDLEKVQCSECEHEWTHPFDTNPTDFFATGS